MPSTQSVLELILDWSKVRPLWQRDALRRIVSFGALDDANVQDLLLLCRKEKGASDIELEAEPLAAEHLPANPGTNDSISLSSLSGVIGVNQLAADQKIPFELSGITVIYGDNGAGKSGYARVLKRACRARLPGAIMPDAYNATAPQRAEATIAYASGGTPMQPIEWKDEKTPHPILSAISVFDRECGTVHVRDKNEVAFRPFGLDIPDDLADVCQRIKGLLTSEQAALEKARDSIFAKPTWKANTRTGKILSSLHAGTNLEDLKRLKELSPEERDRLTSLSSDLAKDPLQAAAEQDIFAADIDRFAVYLKKVATETADTALQSYKAASDDARAKRAAALLTANKAFGQSALDGVGSPVWQELWQAARHYSEHFCYVDKPFPPADEALCVLCHQPLGREARTRLGEFDAFIRADTERVAKEAEAAFAKTASHFESNKVSGISFAAIRRRIALKDATAGKSILRFLGSARMRRHACALSLQKEDALELPAACLAPLAAMDAFAVAARAYGRELRLAADAEGRQRLEAERDDLADRLSLEHLFEKAETEVDRLQSLRLVAACLADTNTTAITKLGNSIADSVITPQLRDRFQSEIVKLAAHRVRVEVHRAGGKNGSPFYQVRLFANPSAPIHNVLSEGEQTCVALAAFLAELATATHQSTLVFDDPVSSLDHRWRQKVAERLVEESGTRQIVVFTHDLIFLNDLNDFAKRHTRPIQLVSLQRGPTGAGEVALELPWSAASVKSRLDSIEKEVRAAKVLDETNDETGYRYAVHRIYSNLRSTWERAIEDVAFHGVLLRHRDYVNTKYLRKCVVLNDNDCTLFETGFKKCCDQTDAHDPSRGRNPACPTPQEMLADVSSLLTWVNSIRDRQKVIT